MGKTKVVRLIQKGGFEPTTSQKRAREIMGRNFFGVEEAIKHFGVNPTYQQLEVLSEIPFSEVVLEQLKDTHVLVAVFPLSISKIHKRNPDLFSSDWRDSRNKQKVSWQLVYKTPVDDSNSRTWDEQQSLLDKNEETPITQVMVYTIIGHFLVTGEWLFKDVYVCCSGIESDGCRLKVGYTRYRLMVYPAWIGDRYYDTSLASARKPD